SSSLDATSNAVQAPATQHGAIQAAAVVSADGTSIGLGGSVSALAQVLPSLAAQGTAGVRFVDVPAAQATLASVMVGGGATWLALSTSGSRPFEIDASCDVFATDLLAYRAGQSRSRWMPGASLALETVWFAWSRNVGAVLLTGVEGAFGTTAVAVGDHTVATILPFRAVVALGVRARF
ncbi:MAG: hypothetical protein ACREJ3_03390, partial [Polyangiaceae bacterium]